MRAVIWRWGHGLIAMSLVFGAAAAAPAAAPIEIRADLGLGGWVVPGRFVPLRVVVSASTEVRGLLEAVVPAAGHGTLTYTHALRVAPHGRQEIVFHVVLTDPRRPLVLRITSGGSEIARSTLPVGVSRVADGIVAALTREAAGLEFLAAAEGKRRAAYLTEAALPARWQAYDAVDLVVIHDLDARAVLPAQQEALVGWVAQGGRLLVIAHEALVIPPWLRPLLPADPTGSAARLPELPVPLARLVPDAGVEVIGDGALPLAVRGRFGRGLVEIWAFDPFSPAGRSWSGRIRQWQALLAAPRPESVATPALADELPQTRPLPGTTQVALALLSIAYIVVLRLVLRRWGASRGGWILVTAVAVVFASALYGFASGARTAARSIAQVSVIEVLPETQRARVTTYVSLLTPYGGSVTAYLSPDAAARPLGGGVLLVDESARAVTGSARGGQSALEVTEIISLDLRAEAVDASGTLQLVVTSAGPLPVDALLYRRRQIYPLGPGVLGARTVLDAARWAAVERPGILGTDLAARVGESLLARLAGLPDEFWLLGRFPKGRAAMRLSGGQAGLFAQMLVAPVRLR